MAEVIFLLKKGQTPNGCFDHSWQSHGTPHHSCFHVGLALNSYRNPCKYQKCMLWRFFKSFQTSCSPDVPSSVTFFSSCLCVEIALRWKMMLTKGFLCSKEYSEVISLAWVLPPHRLEVTFKNEETGKMYILFVHNLFFLWSLKDVRVGTCAWWKVCFYAPHRS